MNPQTVQADFMAELNALLKKWDATISIEHSGRGWHESYDLAVSIDGKYSDDHELLRPYTDFNPGNILDGK